MGLRGIAWLHNACGGGGADIITFFGFGAPTPLKLYHSANLDPSPAMYLPVVSCLLGIFLFTACTSGAQRRPAGAAPILASVYDRPTGFPVACAADEVQVMLLGTFHFQGSARDAVSGTPMDMRSPKRQAELEDLVARFAQWAPDQIAVEWPAGFADSTTARYDRYSAATSATASQNEVVQVGFRLARRLGHPTVYPIDHQMRIGNDSVGALLARRADLQHRADTVLAILRAEAAAEEGVNAGRTIVEILRGMNSDAGLHGGNSRGMFEYLGAGEGENRGGPQLLARWYERNFYIAHNLTRVLRPGTRRVLVLIGAGHVPPLRNIFDESPQFCPVSPSAYLQ